MSESSKIREKVLRYCSGLGVDFGCGDDKIKAEAIGVDLRNLPGVSVVGDACGPLKWALDKTFDYVYSSHFLEHVADPKKCLREWKRILKAGGYMILYLPHKDYYKEPNPEHLHELTMEMVTDWLVELGDIEVVESRMDVEGKDRYSFLIVGRKKGE